MLSHFIKPFLPLNRLLKKIFSWSSEPIQLFLATTWIISGLFMLFTNSYFIETAIPLTFNPFGNRAYGVFIVLIGFLGFYGVFKRDRKVDFVFAAFNVFKNSVLAFEIMLANIHSPEWIQFFVRTLASILLLRRAFFWFKDK